MRRDNFDEFIRELGAAINRTDVVEKMRSAYDKFPQIIENLREREDLLMIEPLFLILGI